MKSPKADTTYRIPLKLTGITCDSCGYDLSGHQMGDSCPECGRECDEFFDDELPHFNDLAGLIVMSGVFALLFVVVPIMTFVFTYGCWTKYAVFRAEHAENPVELAKRWYVWIHMAIIVATICAILNIPVTMLWCWWGYQFFRRFF